MTKEEIVKSAIGETIKYHGDKDWVITEIIRNHVSLQSGHEEEFVKVDYVADLVTERRAFLIKEAQPGIETYFEKNLPLINEYVYNGGGSPYYGYGFNIYDCGISMRNTSNAGTRYHTDRGNGCYILNRSFGFSGGGKDSWYNSPGYALTFDFKFHMYLDKVHELNVDGDLFTPVKVHGGHYPIYFRDYDGNFAVNGSTRRKIYNSDIEPLRKIIYDMSIKTLTETVFDKIGTDDITCVRKPKKSDYEDKINNELWLFNKAKTWVVILQHVTKDNTRENELESKIKITTCNIFGTGRIKRNSSTEAIPKKSVPITELEIRIFCAGILKESLDNWLSEKGKDKIKI